MNDEAEGTGESAAAPFDDPRNRQHPQEMYKLMRDHAPVTEIERYGRTACLVAKHEDVLTVLRNPEVFSSNDDAVDIGQVRPLVPLQIDPPNHSRYRKLTDPLFSPHRVAEIKDGTRAFVRGLVDAIKDSGHVNFHETIAEPVPTTVFLQLLGLPTSRSAEFIALKDGIIRPPSETVEQRSNAVRETGAKIYGVLDELIDERLAEPRDDLISGFLASDVGGQRLTREDVLDIGYLFFLAGLDTVTASLDCIMAFLAAHPSHRSEIVQDPTLIPNAIEELLRWETPVSNVVRVAVEDTELSGCPVRKGSMVTPMLASANTDEAYWDAADTIDFHRRTNKHLAFGVGVHRCLGSHLARMELRVVLEEWHRSVPEYRLREGLVLDYTEGLRQVNNLELVW